MPKRGQTLRYKAHVTYPPSERLPEGSEFVSAYSSLSSAGHEGIEMARRGATVRLLYKDSEDRYRLIFTLTPDNVEEIADDEERIRLYKDADLIRWYRRRNGGAPAEVVPQPRPRRRARA